MKIGVLFGSPETTSGGTALKYYASVRLDIRKAGQIKVGEEVRRDTFYYLPIDHWEPNSNKSHKEQSGASL
jgi:RecA/RadA recombinase